MKVGEVEIGTEYGALASPRVKGYYASRTRPRQVKAVEIVKQEKVRYTGAWTPQKKVQIRRVKVELLDTPLDNGSSWEPIESRAQGSVVVIEARQLIAPWADLVKDVKKGIEVAAARDALEARLEARIKELGFKGGDVWVQVRIQGEKLISDIEFSGKDLDRILELAEAGKEALR